MPFPAVIRLFFACLASLLAINSLAAEKLQFNRDIRPILSDRCFYCHGFDAKKREADLRLDEREVAVEAKAIVPGKPELSEVIARVMTDDPDDHMPPAKSKLPSLTKAEIETLKRWIAEGAEYEAHWSFVPLKLGVRSQESGAAAAEIDKIVEAGLQQRGLKLQPEASAETLIRRLSFDLTGLPPSPADVLAFSSELTSAEKTPTTPDSKSSPSDRILASWADRLLASAAYGERMAVDWLDISRYADSYGFQVDREREVWMWRDWVVRAFNDNLPFDRFVTWQLAGDLLPDATDDQVLATAFNRLHQQESEGGSVEEEYRVEYVCDRVQTFATAFLGLTFECARCHDHKYDPVTQRDYYGLFSMFQNVDEAGLYSFFTPSPPTPAMMLMEPPAKEKMQALAAKVAEMEKHAGDQEAAMPGKELARYSFDVMEKNKFADALNPSPPAPPPSDAKADAKDKKGKKAGPPETTAVLRGENEHAAGRHGKAVKFTGDDPVDLPLGNFKRSEPFSISLWLQTPDVKDRAVVFHRSRAWTDAASRGYELLIEEGRLKWSLIHFWPGNAISIRARQPLKTGGWQHVTATYDGSSRASGLRLFVNGKPAETEIIRDSLTKTIQGGGGDNIALGERFRDRGFKGGLIDEFRIFNKRLTSAEAAIVFQNQSLSPHSTNSPHWPQLQAAREALYSHQDAQQEIMVMKELPQPKKSYILFRGEYNQRKDEVTAQSPQALGLLPESAPRDRLALAKWLASPQHPLFARVTVNRIWQSIWGRGLVRTAEDFGSQGARPLYPELLDHLAASFIQSGWDVKALIKQIVMSKTYRQQSIANAKTMADDPDNEWLARGPRFRLPAEMIRDNALAAAGLLNAKLGGKPVLPYEMTEAFKPAGPGAGDDVYRRSLYSVWRRTSPPPAMTTFDAPKRSVCTAKRERTDSPLQALILLNGVQYVEAARVLGEALHRETKGDAAKMIESAFLRCLSRRPDAKERAICQKLHEEQLAHFKSKPQEAAKLLKNGNAKADATIPPHDLAAATVLCQALLNHDECVVKR